MDNKIGINISLWTTRLTDDSLPLLEKIKAAGYDGIEVPVFGPDVEYCQWVAKVVKPLGLEMTAISSMTPEANPVNPDPAIRKASLEHIKSVLDSAAELGTPQLGGPFHSCYKEFTKKGPTGEEMQWSAEVMRAATEYAEQYNMVLAPEALNRFECYLINTAAQARELVRLTDHPNFGYHHDTHHANLEEKNTPEAIRASAEVIKHVHISDSDRGTPGRGQAPWEGIFTALKDIEYNGWLTIEAFAPDVANFSEHINVWREYSPKDEIYQEGIAFIKKMLAKNRELSPT